jgi:hypothetical protein
MASLCLSTPQVGLLRLVGLHSVPLSSESAETAPASRPLNPFRSGVSSLPPLKHVEGTVVTRKDGSRVLEKIDRETGAVLQESLPAVSSVCGRCGQDLGFQFTVLLPRTLTSPFPLNFSAQDPSQSLRCEGCRQLELLAPRPPPELWLESSEIEARIHSALSRAIALPLPLRLLAIDFDATICQVSPYPSLSLTRALAGSHLRSLGWVSRLPLSTHKACVQSASLYRSPIPGTACGRRDLQRPEHTHPPGAP